MITYSEVSASGITEDEFNEIATSKDGLARSVVVKRHNPNFQLHDVVSARSGDTPFSVVADDNIILRAYNDAGTVYVEYLLVEDNDSSILGSWSAPTSLSTALSGQQPKVFKNGSNWNVVFVNASGAVRRYASASGTGSWTGSDWGSIVIPTDGSVKFTTFGSGSTEIFYYWKLQTSPGVSYYALHWCTPGADWTSIIHWHDAPTGLDCASFTDASDDAGILSAGSDCRHLITTSVPMPTLFEYSLTGSSTPVKTPLDAGGVISFLVRPPNSGEQIQFSKYHPVHTYDKQTSIQYRRTCHVSGMSSIFSSDANDTLWCAVIGSDGDENGTDLSYNYSALYYYSTRDGIFWSRDKAIPVTDLTSLSDFTAGVHIVRCGNYVYTISSKTTLRSLASYEFGITHPDWELDVTDRVTRLGMSASDMRQTSLSLNNRDNYFGGSILTEPGTFSLEMYIGKSVASGDYLFKVATQEIDTIQPSRERPTEELSISARDRMSWLNDRTESADAIEYDTQIVGLDTYTDIAGIENSGLAHTDTVKGTFVTKDGTLRNPNKYTEAIEFSTFKAIVADGGAETTFQIPDPSIYGDSESAGNSYAGIIFRATDKDNFHYVQYNRVAQRIIVGHRRNGIDMPMAVYPPPSEWNTRARTGQYVSFRIEFKHNIVACWTKDNNNVSSTLFTYYINGNTSGFTPIMQGFVGQYSCGYSDENTSDYDLPFDPIGLSFDPLLTDPTLTVDSLRLLADTKSIAAFNGDGKVYITNNFDGVTPTWTGYSLGMSGTPVQFAVDAFSDGYLGSGASINGWVVTTTSIYKVVDIFGARSVTLLKSLRGTTSFRSLDASFGASGYVILTSAYTDGVYSTKTTDGGIWTNEILVGAALNGARSPGIHVSSKTIGKAYSSALVSSGVADGYSTLNTGLSWNRMSSPDIDPGGILAGEIHVPYNNNTGESIAYIGRYAPDLSSATWSYAFDFTAARNGFTGFQPGPEALGWGGAGGTGFSSTGYPDAYTVAIVNKNNMPSGFSSITVKIISSVVSTLSVKDRLGGTIVSWTTLASGSVQTFTYPTPFSITSGIRIDLSANVHTGTPTLRIREMDATGTGSDPYAPWTVTYNFVTSDNGFTLTPPALAPGGVAAGPEGRYVPGVGWQQTFIRYGGLTFGQNLLSFGKQLANLGSIGSMTLGYNVGNTFSLNIHMFIGDWFETSGWFTASNPATQTTPVDEPQGGAFKLDFYNSGDISLTLSTVTSLTLSGTGQPPSGTVAQSPILHLSRISGSAKKNVSPSIGYLPWKSRWQVSTSPVDRKHMVTVCGNSDQSSAGIWTSVDGGDHWHALVATAAVGSRYERAAISGDGRDGVYVFGTNGVIGYSLGLSGSVSSKKGAISTSGEFIGICGGPLT